MYYNFSMRHMVRQTVGELDIVRRHAHTQSGWENFPYENWFQKPTTERSVQSARACVCARVRFSADK